jgi:hypothetical protein
MEWTRWKEAAAAIRAAKMEQQQGGDSYVPYVALCMFWYKINPYRAQGTFLTPFFPKQPALVICH